jgi:sugar lactone lactonase YvrE
MAWPSSPDQRLMYHANTPAHRINVYDYDLATGQTSQCRLLRQFDSDKSARLWRPARWCGGR